MNKNNAIKGGKFLVLLILSYVIISVLFLFIPLELIELITAKTVIIFTGGKIVFQEPVLILFENFKVQISYLCTGLMEFILLASALIATAGIKKEKKIIGIIGAGITTYIFNVIRIALTISLIENTSTEIIELTHNILFKITLFALIAGYYFIWYYLSVKKAKKSKNNHV